MRRDERAALFQPVERVIRWLLVPLLAAMVACAPTVKKAERVFTPSIKSEKEMGQEFAQEAAKKLSLVEDPEVVEYVSRIGEPIIQAAQPMPYRFRFHVVKSPGLNAFAVPGGHLYLFSGLLLKAQSANEVAAVIAHELSHVKHRHTAQMIGKGTLVSLTSLAAILVGAVATGGEGGQAVMAGALGAGQAAQLAFTREFEEEADRFGLFYMYQAGYDPRGLLDFFATMSREQRLLTSRIPPYLLTHPMVPERMDQIENLIRVHRLEVREPRDEPDFYRFQGILQAEVGEPTQTIPLLKQRVEDRPDDPRRWHQLALTYIRSGWTNEALKALETAVALDPGLSAAWVDLGALLARLERTEEAQEAFRRALALRPEYAQAYVEWGKMLLRKNQTADGLALLDKAVSMDPNLIVVHELRAKAKKEMKDEAGFHEEMASYCEKLDRSLDAIQHLRLALKIHGESTPKGEEIKRRIALIQSS